MPTAVKALRTVGTSGKAVNALVYPVVAALLGSVSSWIVTGDLGGAEIRTAASGAILALVAALGAYRGEVGEVEIER